MKLLLVLKKKRQDTNYEFCPFCGEREAAFYDINPYHGEIDLDDEKFIENEKSELSSINTEDWLLP